MGFLRFNKLPRHRTFRYIPRYYDPQKEELKTIINNAKNEGNFDNIDDVKERIRYNMKRKQFGGTPSRKEVLTSNIRILLLVFFLGIVAYLLLNFNIDKILHYLG